MKRISSFPNIAAAHHAMNLLRSDGIPAVVRNEFLASAMGELPPSECQPEVWVLDDSDEWRAKRTLENPPAAAGPAWGCEACGEVSEPQFTHCWKCGRSRRA